MIMLYNIYIVYISTRIYRLQNLIFCIFFCLTVFHWSLAETVAVNIKIFMQLNLLYIIKLTGFLYIPPESLILYNIIHYLDIIWSVNNNYLFIFVIYDL